MRDQALGGLAQCLGNLAQQTCAGVQRPVQRQRRLSAADLADGPRHRPAFHRRAEFHRPDHHRGHRFQRQSGRRASMWISAPAPCRWMAARPASIGTTDRQLHHRAQHRAGRQWQRQLHQWPAFHLRHRQQRHGGAGRRHQPRLARRHGFLAILRSQRCLPVQRALRPRNRPVRRPTPAAWRRAAPSPCRSRARTATSSSMSASPPRPAMTIGNVCQRAEHRAWAGRRPSP